MNTLKLAGDPTWDLGGFALPLFLPPGVGLAIAGAGLVAGQRLPALLMPVRGTATA